MLDHLTRAALAGDHRAALLGDAQGLRRGRQARRRRAAAHAADRSPVDTR